MTLVSFPVLECVFAVERAASHPPAKCKFKEHKCHQCGKVGHIKLVCHSRPVDKANQPSKRWRNVHSVQDDMDTEPTNGIHYST